MTGILRIEETLFGIAVRRISGGPAGWRSPLLRLSPFLRNAPCGGAH